MAPSATWHVTAAQDAHSNWCERWWIGTGAGVRMHSGNFPATCHEAIQAAACTALMVHMTNQESTGPGRSTPALSPCIAPYHRAWHSVACPHVPRVGASGDGSFAAPLVPDARHRCVTTNRQEVRSVYLNGLVRTRILQSCTAHHPGPVLAKPRRAVVCRGG